MIERRLSWYGTRQIIWLSAGKRNAEEIYFWLDWDAIAGKIGLAAFHFFLKKKPADIRILLVNIWMFPMKKKPGLKGGYVLTG